MRSGKTCKYKQSKTWTYNPRETQIWTWLLGCEGSSSRRLRKCNYLKHRQDSWGSMNNNLSTYFAALIHYKVSTYVRKVFLKYAISSAFLKYLQSSLPNTDQEEKKMSLELENLLPSRGVLSTDFKFCLSRENKIKSYLKLYF